MICHKKTLLATLIVGILSPLLLACSNDLPEKRKTPIKIDFQDVVSRDQQGPVKEKHQALRIAVAAMISPESTYKYYVDLLELIAERLGSEVDFVQKRTYVQINEMLKKRELDFAFVCSGAYVMGKADFGMEIIAVPVSQGEKVYHSYVIVHKESVIQSFDQLRDKIFAFTDPHSNTGCLVPTYLLARRNETPGSFFKGTFFTHSHDNSIKAVAEGLADGAAVDSLIWEFMSKLDPELTSRTRVIEKSPPYGMPPIVIHPSMEGKKKEKLRTLFLSLHKDPKGKEHLNAIRIDCFEAGNDEDYNSVREMQKWIDSKKG
jgi:phosphonate transport system substrate-binding protein